MLVQPSKPTDSILGYNLRAKIGSGGYGEVWSAEAPGGLTKAVKLIFGYHDEGRAQRELKALNRIKQVRHPFLLSLERIDVVDGRLVVVTELAEQSLKDRFRTCVANGDVGIGRKELLGYLTDAAEALDYIYESHSLLHLDVKPENLLLVGGHVKLADFGLVKDIEESLQSMMGGLTPTYAAPEVFDGQPGRTSDQYSLAIVFQEMLTGRRPFAGSTPAKLALQHLHETPDLSYLTPGDQGTLRRALAKSPSARFPDCRSFIDELTQRRSRPRRRKPESPEPKPNESTPADTFAKTIASPIACISSLAKAMVGEQLPPLDVNTEDAKFQPTLFIGIGQTATSVLRHLKRRFQERLGDGDKRPALRILCLDTDSQHLNESLRATDLGRLDHDEILPLPLKTSAEYRENAESHLAWLSRRWIYNIPRSRQTEGLRPLGRLALVDHHDKVFDRLHRLIAEMTESDAVGRTAKLCEMRSAEDNPKVFVVASISGGAGSGMVADLAYTVRMVLAERGMKDDRIYGILLSSSAKSATRRDITVANTYCCLSELYHYSYLHGYPGDPSCDLPAFEDGPTFDSTYLVDMGNDPLADEYTALADLLAEYLYLDAATACGTYLSACREEQPTGDGMYLRTLGVSHSGGADGDAVSLSANALCNHVLRHWLRPSEQCVEHGEEHPSLVGAFTDIGLDADQLASRFREQLETRIERDLLGLVQHELEPFCQMTLPGQIQTSSTLIRAIEDAADHALGISGRKSPSGHSHGIKSAADCLVDALGDQIATTIADFVLSQLDKSIQRLAQTESTHRHMIAQVDRLAERAAAKQRVVRERLSSIVQQISDGSQLPGDQEGNEGDRAAELVEAIRQYGHLRLYDFLAAYLKRTIGRVRQQLDQLSLQVAEVRQELTRLADDFERQYAHEERHGLPGVTASNAVASSLIFDFTMADVDNLVAQLDAAIQQQYFEPLGGFRMSQDDRYETWKHDLTQTLYRLARSLIAARIEVNDFDVLLQRHGITEERVSKWVDESLKLATPNLYASCGGKSRLIVALPRGSKGELLQQALAKRSTVNAKFLSITDGDIAFCYEIGGIPIHQVAAKLLQSCPRSTELVARLHARTDVNWTPLIRLE
jgi:serine/threonine protein kinase